MASNIVVKTRGDKSIVYIIHYTDDDGYEVEKGEATSAVINEYEGETLVNSSIGLLD